MLHEVSQVFVTYLFKQVGLPVGSSTSSPPTASSSSSPPFSASTPAHSLTTNLSHSSLVEDPLYSLLPPTPSAFVVPSSNSKSPSVRQDWLTPGRCGWKFVCPGPSGGGGPESLDISNQMSFACQDCKATEKTKWDLAVHKKFHCSMVGDFEREEFLAQGGSNSAEEITSTTYRVDSEMEEFLESHPSAYAKYRLCENKRNPQPLRDFWPVLFDYRGTLDLAGLETKICTKQAYQRVAGILSDAYTFHGVTSITYKKKAVVELSDGSVYDITKYRVPKTHCKVNEGVQVRLDQPRFKVTETGEEVTISLHERYLELLPCYIPSQINQEDMDCVVGDQEVYDDHDESLAPCQDFETADRDLELNLIFEEEGVILSQVSDVFSQVSLEDSQESYAASPAQKRIKLETKVQEPEPVRPQPPELDTENVTQARSKNCPHCNVYISSAHFSRHITKSCPENPNIDELERLRRRRKLEKNLKAKEEVKVEVKYDINKNREPTTDPKENKQCTCPGPGHQPDCLRLRGGAAHGRIPRNNQGPHLAPDPDFLPPNLLRPVIPIIQALNQQLTNRQNRWIAGIGPPRLHLNLRNTLWPRVASKYQLPHMFSDTEFQDLFFITRQQMFQFRVAVVTPMLAQLAAQANGARGARNSLPHTLTPDSLSCLFFMKIRLGHTDRELAAQFGITHKHVIKWNKRLRNYYFTTDPFIRRNMNLGNQANMTAILQQGIAATSRCPRTTAQYGHLQVANTQLLVVIMDSRAVRVQQSRDSHLQKRSISTKIKDNSVQKMTISTSDGAPMISFPLMCSISPAGTDESNCEHLITIQENANIIGGLRGFLESPLTNQVTMVILLDQGFRKFGFDHANRRSFLDYLDHIKAQSNGKFQYFLPCFPGDPYKDRQFNDVAVYPNLPGGSRHRCRTANTSAACCTKARWAVEGLFGRESQLKLLGTQAEVPNQYLQPCGIPNFDSQTTLSVLLHIGTGVNNRFQD